VDPNALPSDITPGNTLRGKRLGFGVRDHQVGLADLGLTPGGMGSINPMMVDPNQFKYTANIKARSVKQDAMDAFMAQLPQMNQDFADASEQLVKNTAAMGRTGSALFNRDTGYTSDRARNAREAMLGNMSFQGASADASNDLQGQIAGANIGAQNAAMMAQLAAGNANRDLSAQNMTQGNILQRAGLLGQIAQNNANRAWQTDQMRQQHLSGLQGREDVLADKAMQDRATQWSMMQPGAQWGVDPFQGVGDIASILQGASGQHGAQAGLLNTQMGGMLSGLLPAIGSILQGPQTVMMPGQQQQGGGGFLSGLIKGGLGLLPGGGFLSGLLG
jgi:hypothetical protein